MILFLKVTGLCPDWDRAKQTVLSLGSVFPLGSCQTGCASSVPTRILRLYDGKCVCVMALAYISGAGSPYYFVLPVNADRSLRDTG